MSARTDQALASFHEALALTGQLVEGYRPGDRVRVSFGGVSTTGTIADFAWLRRIGEQVVFLDGTGQHVKVTESIVERI